MLRLRGFSEGSFIFDDPIFAGSTIRQSSSQDNYEETDECIRQVDIFSRTDRKSFVEAGPVENLNYIKAYNIQYNLDKADPDNDWNVKTDDLPKDVRNYWRINYAESVDWDYPIYSPSSICDSDYSPPPPPYPANDPNRNLLQCIWSDPAIGGPWHPTPEEGQTVLFRHVFGLPRGQIINEIQLYLSIDDDALDPEVRNRDYETRRGFIYVNEQPFRFPDSPGMDKGIMIPFPNPNSLFNPGGKNLLAFMINDELKSWQTLKYFLRIRVQLEDCAPPSCKSLELDLCVRSTDVLIENTSLAAPPYVQRYSAGGLGSAGNPKGVFEHYDLAFQLNSEWVDLTTAGPNVVTSRTDEGAQSRISICDLAFEAKIFPRPGSNVVIRSQSLSTIVKPTLGNDWSGVPIREYGLFAEYNVRIRTALGVIREELYGARVTIAPDEDGGSAVSRSFFDIAPLQQMKRASPFFYVVGRSYPSAMQNYPLVAGRMYRMCLQTRALFSFDSSGEINWYALVGSLQINSLHNSIHFNLDFAGNVVRNSINPYHLVLSSRIGLVNMNGTARFEATEVGRDF